jgi:hypothetical protein
MSILIENQTVDHFGLRENTEPQNIMRIRKFSKNRITRMKFT